MSRKSTSEQRIKRALVTLDKAVQAWYEENQPNNRQRYASLCFMDYPRGEHVAYITLKPKEREDEYLSIYSPMHNFCERS